MGVCFLRSSLPRYHRRSSWYLVVDEFRIFVRTPHTSVGCRAIQGRCRHASSVIEGPGVEGVLSLVMGYVKNFCIRIKPAPLLSSNLEDPAGRTCPGMSCGNRKTAYQFPVLFESFKDRNLLGVVADPDQILGRACIPPRIHVGRLHVGGIFF